MTPDEASELVEDFAAKLGEHFDAVQILTSWMEDGNTINVNRGTGNWYARQGMAHEFIDSSKADDAAVKIAERIHESEDED